MILQSDPGALIGNFLPLILIILVMYFFFLRPQAKKQKAQTAFINELEKGKKVVTASGIIGTIIKLDDQIVTLQISQKGVVDVLRSTVSHEMTEALSKASS